MSIVAANAPVLPTWNFPTSWEEVKKSIDESSHAQREPRDDVKLGDRDASWRTDLVAVTQFAASGFLYTRAGKSADKMNQERPPLSDVSNVKMNDPLVLVPGWTTLPEKFDRVVDQLLASDQNGKRPVYLKEGQAFSDKECLTPTEIAADDKVFVAVFDTPLDAPDKSAPQLNDAIAAVKKSGHDKVDVVGYSMGGLAIRKMLQDDGQKLDQVAMLGTANRGTRFATLAKYIVERDIGWAMSLGNINVSHLPALSWLKAWDAQDPESNPMLDDLNKNIDHQLSGANEFLSIGSRGLSTISKSWGGSEGGDGLVPHSSVELPGLPTVLLEGRGNKQHGNLPHDSDVFRELTDFFGWEKVA